MPGTPQYEFNRVIEQCQNLQYYDTCTPFDLLFLLVKIQQLLLYELSTGRRSDVSSHRCKCILVNNLGVAPESTWCVSTWSLTSTGRTSVRQSELTGIVRTGKPQLLNAEPAKSFAALGIVRHRHVGKSSGRIVILRPR
ncbi:hypothetical protein KC352_g9 [Hortaea werneckii]|nr:hypothetical protein KC352_g9 [Hortaea werneckii]